MNSVIVIGYGNELRGDDAIGPQVARFVATWGAPGVRALAAHQLTPELAADLAGARAAIFVDARCAEDGDAAVDVRSVAPRARRTSGHAGDPGDLLALAEMAYGAAPRAWLVSVPAINFGYGEDLSHIARRGVVVGLRAVHDLMMRLQHAEIGEDGAAARLAPTADCARATPGRAI